MPSIAFATPNRRARLIVSLADNAHQSIVPIKPSLGNGQKPSQNLYWRALYGMKTHFKRMDNWSVESRNIAVGGVLDAIRLTHEDHSNIQIDVEAWDGAKQLDAVRAYFSELKNVETGADLVGFIGHNVLMDIPLPNLPVLPHIRDGNLDNDQKGVVIACKSASYFNPHLRSMGVDPYVMTKGLMAPEAYVLQGILEAWLAGGTGNSARQGAAKQYAKYQKIPLRSANWLFGVKSK